MIEYFNLSTVKGGFGRILETITAEKAPRRPLGIRSDFS
jgi:hypothetical protein